MPLSFTRQYLPRTACLVLLGGLLVGSQFIRAEEPAEKKAAAPAAAEKAEVQWQPLFDGKTLDGWKPTEFGTGGEILVEDGRMLISFGDGCTGVTWQKDFPKVDYEVRVEAQRVDGTDFFCGMTFPVQESPCSLIVGGWGGAVVGLSSIDGEDAAHNKTSQYMTFKKGQWYNVRLRVTKTRVTVWIDEKQVIDQETTGHKLTIRPEVKKSLPFGICSWSTTAALRKVELRKLTEEESQPMKAAEPEKK
ncbi:MAG: DUF1080 domain-containing protein [Planctomycetota bacterium]